MAEKRIRIGGAPGTWFFRPPVLSGLLGAGVDYLILGGMSEETIVSLARARLSDPRTGFVAGFPGALRHILPDIARRGVKIATAAGGVNPVACQWALEEAIGALGLGLRVGVVRGDDILPLADALRASGCADARTGELLPEKLLGANVHLGAPPIKAAFDRGADIVIAGRCSESALALGVLMHEFGWTESDYDLLAAGCLAAHILACERRPTGGDAEAWARKVEEGDPGFAIADVARDGSFELRLPEPDRDGGGALTMGASRNGATNSSARTGGGIGPAEVAERALDAVGDPSVYLQPDVAADFSAARLTPIERDRVRVEGLKGRPPTHLYCASAVYRDGYQTVATTNIAGRGAGPWASRIGEDMIERGRRALRERGLADFSATLVEPMDRAFRWGDSAATDDEPDLLLRVVARHAAPEALELFRAEVDAWNIAERMDARGTTLSGAPAPPIASAWSWSPPRPVFRSFGFKLDKRALDPPRARVGAGQWMEVEIPMDGGFDPASLLLSPRRAAGVWEKSSDGPRDGEPDVEVPLGRIARAHAGERGMAANIAIIAREPRYFPLLRREVTPDRVLAQLAPLTSGPAVRFEAPGLYALNFVLAEPSGATTASMRFEPRAIAFGRMAVEMPVRVPESWT